MDKKDNKKIKNSIHSAIMLSHAHPALCYCDFSLGSTTSNKDGYSRRKGISTIVCLSRREANSSMKDENF